jgi:predicted sulfurtransferase
MRIQLLHLLKNIVMRYLWILIIAFSAGCDSQAQNGKALSVEEFERGMADKNVQLLDVRTAGEFRNGHLKAHYRQIGMMLKNFKNVFRRLIKTNRFIYIAYLAQEVMQLLSGCSTMDLPR